MKKVAWPFILLAAIAIPSLGSGSALRAKETTPTPILHPSTPWMVDYADNECRLVRNFGTGDDTVTMRLARGSGLQSFDMVFAGTQIPRLGEDVKIVLKLEPQGTKAEFNGYSLRVPDRPENFIRWYDGSPEILEGVTNGQKVHLLAGGRVDIAMLWSDGKAALAALQTCHDDLLKGWGVDIDEIRALKVPPEPIGSPGRWATNADYPDREVQNQVTGTVAFKLKIDVAGNVENCLILLSSDSATLDEQTCKLMLARAKFKPARDANDQPTTSFYVNRVRWQIP